MRFTWCHTLVGCSLLFPLLYACSAPVAPSPTALPVQEDEVLAQDYVIGPEDSVEVQVWKNPDLSRTVTVRPDGKISLPLIGDVPAAGQTATQLTEAVTEKLKTYYREPAQVTVIVSQVNSYVIYVLGEVKTQGKQVVRSGTTFLQAVSLAGGFTPFASTSKITLRRRGSAGKETAISIRYKDVLTGRQANLVLKPGDTIIVP
ncbi:MAG TPA: polysaccharide biosynthesis/export family protein [Candidatus Saccharimonadia bacterium]|nr:polysaccharide biosynthesis/export family protein [Candidatus Saccharimonadia bacterium]